MKSPYPGILLTFEGPDGAGKSSHVQAVAERIRSAGYEVVVTREPGGSPLAEKIRALLLSEAMGARAEVLLFAAARADHMEQLIVPALSRGAVVISDRFVDSTYAYQGAGRELYADVLRLETMVLKGFEPNYTLFFDVSKEESTRRLATRAAAAGETNRLDQEREAFKQRVYDGYRHRFMLNQHRMHRIDAMQSIEEVRESVLAWIDLVLIPQLSATEGSKVLQPQ